MSPLLVALCYGSALVIALLMLQHFGAKHFTLHILAVVAAFAIGLTPLPAYLNTPTATLAIGWLFVFLLVWGVGALYFAIARHTPYLGHHTR